MIDATNCCVEEGIAYKNSLTVNQAVDYLMTASGLSTSAAKTCVYYAIGTYGLDRLNLYPLLVIYGPTGTGKSSAMKALAKLVIQPEWMGTSLTKAGLRDKLNNAKNATAFIEEGDVADEDYIANRYSRETSKSSVKRAVGTGWKDDSLDYFGATVLHKRKPFNDPATESRSILIKTRANINNQYHLPDVDSNLMERLKQIWEQAYPMYKEMETSGRAADAWKPLIAAATACNDTEWLRFAADEVKKAMDKLRLGQEFEPEAIIVNALVSLSRTKQSASMMEIKDEMKKETNWQPSSWALTSRLSDLGFDLKKSHGHRKVVLDKIKIATIGVTFPQD